MIMIDDNPAYAINLIFNTKFFITFTAGAVMKKMAYYFGMLFFIYIN